MEDMLLIPPPQEAAGGTAPVANTEGSTGALCTREQRQAIRSLLLRAGKTESWLLAKLQLKRLDDLMYARAELVIRRLGELANERQNSQR